LERLCHSKKQYSPERVEGKISEVIPIRVIDVTTH
jgi:hypothetical protein